MTSLFSALTLPRFCAFFLRSMARITAGRCLMRPRQPATFGKASSEELSGFAMNAQGKAIMSQME